MVAEVTVAGAGEIAWTVEQARTRLFEDLRLALGSDPRAIDVLVTLRTGRSSARTDRVTVGGEQG